MPSRPSRTLLLAAALVAALAGGCGPETPPQPFHAEAAEARMPRVVAALRNGDGDGALAELDRLAAQGPLPDGALLYRALALETAGRDAESLDVLQAELAAHPGDGRAHGLLARHLLEAGKLDEADAELRLARQLAPDDLPTRLFTARLALLRKSDEAALRAFQDVLAADPWGSSAAEAHDGLAQILARRGAEGAAAAQQHALAGQRLGELNARLRDARAAQARHPDDVEAALGVAGAFMDFFQESGDARLRDEAEAAFQRVLALRPEDARALCSLGVLRAAERRFPEALELTQHALRSDPDLIIARLSLALLHVQLGHTEEAVHELEIVAERASNPQDRARAHVHIAHLLQDTADAQVRAQAIAHAQAALDLVPGDPYGAGEMLAKLQAAAQREAAPPADDAPKDAGPP